jgi:hypothetical protein
MEHQPIQLSKSTLEEFGKSGALMATELCDISVKDIVVLD